MLAAWPLPRKAGWVDHVNTPQTEAELAAVRSSVNRGSPFGNEAWSERTIRRLGLESTFRPGDGRKSTKTVPDTFYSLFDSFGNIESETHYDASGTVVSSGTGYLDEAFAFTGRYFDKVTGDQNNLDRWYDPTVGSWLSQDPLPLPFSDVNPYRYADNMPTMLTDPQGLAGTTGSSEYGNEQGVHYTTAELNQVLKNIEKAMRDIRDEVTNGEDLSLSDAVKKVKVLADVTGNRSKSFEKAPEILKKAVNDVESNPALTVASIFQLVRYGLNRKLNWIDDEADRGLGDAWLMMEYRRLEWLHKRIEVIASQNPPTPIYIPTPKPTPTLGDLQPPVTRLPSPHGQPSRREYLW